MIDELHQALLAARFRGGPLALSARQSLRMATIGGARCLGRTDELGSLEPGKLADVALWQVGGLAGAGIADPVTALVFGAPALDRLWVGGQPVVSRGELVTADPDELTAGQAAASARIGRSVRAG
jgi:cytosine/adenosine deaminase-related metal-dependent hydrolase